MFGHGQWTIVDVDKDNTEFKMKYIQFLKSVRHNFSPFDNTLPIFGSSAMKSINY